MGPLFECINCADFYVCIKCEAHLQDTHDAAHAFCIHFEDISNANWDI